MIFFSHKMQNNDIIQEGLEKRCQNQLWLIWNIKRGEVRKKIIFQETLELPMSFLSLLQSGAAVFACGWKQW